MNDLCVTGVWHCGSWVKGSTFSCCGWLAAVQDSTRQYIISLTVLHNLATKGRVGSKSRSCCELNIPTLLSLRVLSFLFNHSPSKILVRFIWLRQFKENNRNENSQPPSKPRTRHRRLCRSASRSLKRRRRVNPPEASSLH
jgi:hypothetical protein